MLNTLHTSDSSYSIRSKSLVDSDSPQSSTKDDLAKRPFSSNLTVTSTFNLDEQKADPTSVRSSEGNTVHDIIGNHKEKYPKVLDDDLTMVEISDMRIAEELMCNRHLRPPMPIGIPSSKKYTIFLYLNVY